MTNSLEEKIVEVEKLLYEKKTLRSDLHIFLITHGMWLRLYKGNLEKELHLQEYAYIRRLQVDRGEILNIFSKLEFFVNEFIQAKLLGLFSPKADYLGDILQYVEFFSRMKILEQWDIIDEDIFDIIQQMKQVRNGLAHRWKESEVNYKGKMLQDNFGLFKEDLEKVLRKLIDIHIDQEKNDIDRLITYLKAQ